MLPVEKEKEKDKKKVATNPYLIAAGIMVCVVIS